MKQRPSAQRASDAVWNQIQDHTITIRSPWSVWGERLGYLALFLLALTAGILLANLIFYWFAETRQIELLRLGPPGVLPFLEAIPYHWIILVVGFFLLGFWIARHSDVSYRRSLVFLALGLALVILIGGGLVARSRLNHHIVDEIGRGHFQPLRPFYDPPTRERQTRFNLIGQVTAVGEHELMLEIRDRTLTVYFDDETLTPMDPLVSGDRVRVIGRPKDKDSFQADAMFKLPDHPKELGLSHFFLNTGS